MRNDDMELDSIQKIMKEKTEIQKAQEELRQRRSLEASKIIGLYSGKQNLCSDPDDTHHFHHQKITGHCDDPGDCNHGHAPHYQAKL